DPTTVGDEINSNCECQGETIPGCMNEAACNYDPNATVDDGSCILIGDSCDDGDPTTVGDEINANCECEGETIPGCMNEAACNYDPNVTVDDGSCTLIGDSCDDGDPTTVGDEINANCECEGETIPGCTNEAACNYDPNATVDDGSCILIGDSCDDGDPTTVGDEINANCECQGETIPGCTNEAACNYDPNATVDDGSCILIGDSCDDGDPTTVGDEINANCECEGETVPGCMNEAACNYDPNATVDDGSCILIGDSCDDGDPATVNDEFNSSCVCEGQTVPGCTDANACNYDPGATVDDGTCLYPNDSCDDGDPETGNDMFDENCNCSGEVILGCVIPIACNYNPEATVDDGSCLFPGDSCDDGDPTTANDTLEDNCDCNGEVIPGCMDNTACNYNAEATVDDGSCDYSCYGCTDETACNFDPSATLDDGECVFGTTLYLDSDGDGFGNPDQSITSCGEEGYVEDNTDCDDTNPDVYPGAPGTNEGIDNNCDGEVGPGEVPTCLADFNNSGYINTADLLIFLSHYDCQENCECDLNGDDTVETSDLLIMLSLMGTNCTD
ncbi:putative metal-binding motif-containing protein, partial [Halocola ammonii]